MTNTALVLERLSENENFQSWNLDRIAHLAMSEKTDETPPWEGEPDKVQWIDPDSGFDCLILRNHSGALCGYVGVPPGHPYHGLDYSAETPGGETPEQKLEVHGQLTFSNFCSPGEPVDGICHRAAPGRPDNVWWFGFDCAHAWDWVPILDLDTMPTLPESDKPMYVYRDLEYVVEQNTQLAKQLAAL